MIGYGPSLVVEILQKYLTSLPTEIAISELEKHKDKLDQYHRHVFLSTVYAQSGFCVFSAIDTEKRQIIGVSITDPFEKNLMIYNSTFEFEVLQKIYRELFNTKVEFLKSGITRLPFQHKVLAVFGDGDFLQKEMLKEKIYGVENLSFCQKINQQHFEKLRRLNEKKIDFAMIYPLDEYIVCILTMPEYMNKDHASLLSEISRIYRKKYGAAYQGNVDKIKKLSSVLSAFVVSYEDFLKGFDVEKSCLELCEKIKKAYKYVIDLA